MPRSDPQAAVKAWLRLIARSPVLVTSRRRRGLWDPELRVPGWGGCAAASATAASTSEDRPASSKRTGRKFDSFSAPCLAGGPDGRKTLRAEPPLFDHGEWCGGPSLTGGQVSKRGTSFALRLTSLAILGVLGMSRPRRVRPRARSAGADPGELRARRAAAAPSGYVTDFGEAYNATTGAGLDQPVQHARRSRSSATPVTATWSPTSGSTRSSTCSSPARPAGSPSRPAGRPPSPTASTT